MENTIKTIAPVNCPHCQKEILVEFVSKSPELASAFTIEAVKTAKADALLKLSELSIDAVKKEDIKKWIEDENTVFGPSEVESIIKSALSNE